MIMVIHLEKHKSMTNFFFRMNSYENCQSKQRPKVILFEIHLSINERLRGFLKQIQNSQNSLTFNTHVITQMFFWCHHIVIDIFPLFILLCSLIRQTSCKQLNLYRNITRMEFIGYLLKYHEIHGEKIILQNCGLMIELSQLLSFYFKYNLLLPRWTMKLRA